MTLKVKAFIGLYVFSILLLSGVSRAEASTGLFINLQGETGTSLEMTNSSGTVFEVDGYLYFETESQESLLVHSSNFDFFQNLELPVRVNADSIIVSQKDGFHGAPRTIRFFINSIKKSQLL